MTRNRPQAFHEGSGENHSGVEQKSFRVGVRLVDQPYCPHAIVHADRWRLASPPVVERIAHCGEIGRGDVRGPGRVSSPSAVASFTIPSFIVRMASRPAIFHSPSVPSRGKPLPTSTVPRMPLVERSITEA